MSTMLIIGYEAVIRLALLETLEENGFKTIEAANADEALKIIKNARLDVDLAIADVCMPREGRGLGLSQQVRKQLTSSPVIVATSHEDIADVSNSEVRELRTKSYDFDRILAKILATIDFRNGGCNPKQLEKRPSEYA